MSALREIIDHEWLQGRYLVLELAALFDRLDAAAAQDHQPVDSDQRIALLHRALTELATPLALPGRAARLLELYSTLAAPAVNT